MRDKRHSVRRSLLAVGVAVPTVLFAAACMIRVNAQPPAKPGSELAGKKFKNIKVLKTLPADRLIPTMRDWNASLGVKCEFCHVEGPNHTGFERDDKPTKNIARSMVTMTMDINKHQRPVDGKATCYLCHHGRPDPETHPTALPGGPGGPGPGR